MRIFVLDLQSRSRYRSGRQQCRWTQAMSIIQFPTAAPAVPDQADAMAERPQSIFTEEAVEQGYSILKQVAPIFEQYTNGVVIGFLIVMLGKLLDKSPTRYRTAALNVLREDEDEF
jgi:hypothetical protein